MIESYIKYFFMLICAIYIFSRLVNIEVTKKQYFINAGVSLLLGGVIYLFRMNFSYMTTAMLFVLVAIYTMIVYGISSKITIMVALLSVVLSYIIFFAASVIISFITSFAIFRRMEKEYLYPISMILIGILQMVLSLVVFTIKRFRRGMPFLLEKLSNTLGVVIGCAIVFFSSFFTVLNKDEGVYYIIMLISIVLGFVFFIWWRKQLNISYIIRSNNNEISRLELEIEKIKKDNERLASLIHKDNKLIPAMVMSVRGLLEEQLFSGDEKVQAKATALLEELKKLSDERSGILDSSESINKKIESTGFIRLDSILSYMNEKAESFDIEFDVKINVDIPYMIKNIVREDILVTLLADLVDNAIIATKEAYTKNILLSIDMKGKYYSVSIYDSGIPFEPYTIENAGRAKASTHINDGGSGIGLMTTFAFLKQNLASFIIDEKFEDIDQIGGKKYTKKVAVMFDYRNQYIVNSYRKEIIDLKENNPRIFINV